MKTPVKILLLLLALIITRPVTRAADQDVRIFPGFNYIGAHVVNAPHGSAAVLGVSGNTITFKTPGWLAVAPLLGAGVKFTVEHPTSGYWDIVTACSGKVVTVSSPWPYGPDLADKPIIRRVMTISQLFGSTYNKPQIQIGTGYTGSPGTSDNPGPAGTADRIWLPNGLGTGYSLYFLNAQSKWRQVGVPLVNQSAVPVYLVQGMIYERIGTTQIDLKFHGEEVTSPRRLFLGDLSPRSMLTYVGQTVYDGSHLVSSVFGLSTTAAKTLTTCGLFSWVEPFCDSILLMENPNSGNVTSVWMTDGADWAELSGNNGILPANQTKLPSGFLYFPCMPTVVTLIP